MQNIHSGHRERVRKKALNYGYDTFNDHELLELLLFNVFPQGDTNILAHNLINHFGSLKGVLEASPLELSKVKGFGERSAVFIGALLPIIKRYLTSIATEKESLKDIGTLLQYAKTLCIGSKVETAYAVYMNKNYKIICTTKLSEGTLEETAVYVEKIVHEAILHQATYVVIIHNHPSGSLKPSFNDGLYTYTLQTNLASFRKILVDSIIVSDLTAYSMRYGCTLSNLNSGVLSYGLLENHPTVISRDELSRLSNENPEIESNITTVSKVTSVNVTPREEIFGNEK